MAICHVPNLLKKLIVSPQQPMALGRKNPFDSVGHVALLSLPGNPTLQYIQALRVFSKKTKQNTKHCLFNL